MRERPILFSGPMVRAILEGRKAQTRRLITSITHRGRVTEFGKSDTPGYGWHFRDKEMRWHDLREEDIRARCPHGAVGDHLWVRETWGPCAGGVVFRADDCGDRLVCPDGGKWKPSIFMPRWASRITLEITGIRVERLQDITEEDARAEGCGGYVSGHGPVSVAELTADPGYWHARFYRDGFADKWNAINGKSTTWDSNPWVWVIEFRRTA